MTDAPRNIYHIAQQAEWEAQRASGSYKPSAFENDGFIHCSTKEQVSGTARRFFAGRNDVVLLTIDTEALSSPLRWEEGEPGELFPHVYGPLNVDAVARVEPLKQWEIRGATGG